MQIAEQNLKYALLLKDASMYFKTVPRFFSAWNKQKHNFPHYG